MNKDDFEILRHLKPAKPNSALDLVNGLEDRGYGYFKSNGKAKEKVELFAEEQLVRKQHFDEMRCEMPGLPRSTFLMVFSPDGSRVASTHGNHNIYVTDTRSGKNIKTLVGHPRTPWCIAFHPTSNQIVASGCLGGQVRIWDLSGGSEVWTTSKQSVIASIAFHPNDRVLVIATCNEVYFWDWSQPEPFVHAATSNLKEKVRYVAFDKLGHKLITGIANSPQTRWERVRAPVPVPRQERCASPYRRRITQRLVNTIGSSHTGNMPQENTSYNREPLSGIPEREMRITVCYRNLVREYEQLVHRYLQLYRPPTMIDRGTDPMEPSAFNNSGTQTPPEPSTSATQPGPSTSHAEDSQPQTSNVDTPENPQPGPSGVQPTPSTSSQNTSEASTSQVYSQADDSGPSESQAQPSTSSSQSLITPSRIFCFVKKPNTLIRSTQTPESRKHKTEGEAQDSSQEKRFKGDGKPNDDSGASSSSDNRGGETPTTVPESTTPSSTDAQPPSTPSESPQESQEGGSGSSNSRILLVSLERLRPEEIPPSESGNSKDSTNKMQKYYDRRRYLSDSYRAPSQPHDDSTHVNRPSGLGSHRRRCRHGNAPRGPMGPGSSGGAGGEAGPSSEPSTSAGGGDGTSGQRNVDELLSNIRRTAEEEVRSRILPIIRSVPPNERPELIRLFENSREHVKMRFRQMYPMFLKKNSRRPLVVDSSSDNTSSEDEQASSNQNPNPPPVSTTENSSISASTPSTSTASTSNVAGVRNFNTELEQLVTSLLTEIERNESASNVNPNVPSTSRNTCPPQSSSSARTRLNPASQESSTEPTESSASLSAELDNLFFQDVQPSERGELSGSSNPPPPPVTNVRPTNPSTCPPMFPSLPRRRFFSHRVSAFMPTRVRLGQQSNQRNRRPYWSFTRDVLEPRPGPSSPSFALDELINYSERENSEDDPPISQWNFHPFDPLSEIPSVNPENIGIGNMYSNMIQDLESSLNDVTNIRASSRPGDTSDMLSSFSERLENIMNQSNTILRNLRTSLDMLPSISEANRAQSSEPMWNFNDPGFYVRDLRTDVSNSGASPLENVNLRSSVAADHTYPRNINPSSTQRSDEMLPLINSLVLTITHIQQQARLLRQQVESIERIDRAMLEVAQLQLIRELILQLLRHHRPYAGENRSTGMSSVRQMMAGTRISDSSPYDSPSEDQGGNSQPLNLAPSRPRDLPDPSLPSTSSGTSSEVPSNRPRSSNRKTYPPSRLFRLARHSQRRTPIVQWISRRYLNRFERGVRPNPPPRASTNRPAEPSTSFGGNQAIFNYSVINMSTLSLMTRRLEHLLMDQMRVFTNPLETPAPNRSSASIDLGEHILALRLHGCLLRMNRVLGINLGSGSSRSLRSDATSAVTQDGASRYGVRHTLSLIVDGMSRHIEEVDSSSVQQSMRVQIRAVLATSLLLTELLLLQVVDSIPPPTGMNLDPERESLANNIDQICTQMLQSRFSSGSHQLTRSLRRMKITMRRAYSALRQTYTVRRNAMMPRRDTDRLRLLGSINRRLRMIHRRPGQGGVQDQNGAQQGGLAGSMSSENRNEEGESRPSTSNGGDTSNTDAWYSTVNDLISRYSVNADSENNEPSTSGMRERAGLSSNNDNSEDDDDPDWYRNNNSSSPNSNLYRTNNVNLLPNSEQSNPPRPWNVPSVNVIVNDVAEPVSERGGVYQQRRWNSIGLFRPRFLPPLYADLDDAQREHIYDSDIIATTVTPNHRIQAWDISNWCVPAISNSMKNIVVSECKIHNDASVDVAKDGTILVTLLPSGGYLNVTNRLGVYSLRWETLGQCLYTTSFEQNAVSVSLSPLSRHLVVGLASRRVSIVQSDHWVMARIFRVDRGGDGRGDRLSMLRELEQTRESRINCIRWLPTSGQGLIYATNTGQLVVLS